MLSHALKTEIDADTAAVLRGHAAALPVRDDSAAAVTQEG
jgi:hypothetical protein